MSAANNTQASVTSAREPRTAIQSASILRGFVILASVLAAIACVMYLISAVSWRSRQFPGFTMSYTMVVDGNRAFSEAADWAGQEAGLQHMDRISRINGVDLPATDYAAAREAFWTEVETLSTGDTVDIGFIRAANRAEAAPALCNLGETAGGFTPCEVSYTLQPLPDSDFLAYFAFPFTTAIIALLVGLSLLVFRFKSTNALLIALFCVSLAVFSAGTFNNATTHNLMYVWLAFVVFGGVAAFTLALTFPTRLGITYNQPVVLAVPAVIGGVILAINLYWYATLPVPTQFTTVWQIPVAFAFLSFASLAISLLARRRFVASSIQRDQVNTTLIGIGLAIIPIFLWILSNIALFIDSSLVLPLNSATIMPFFISIPVSMAYAAFQYPAHQSERILSKGITYAVMLGALVVGYFFVVTGFKFLTQEFIQADNPFVIAATIFIIAVAFLPVRTRLQSRIDRIYYRERRNFQDHAEEFARDVATTSSFSGILSTYMRHVTIALKTRGVFVYLPDDETDGYVASALSNPQTDIRFEATSDLIRLLNRTQDPIVIGQQQRWDAQLVSEKSRLNILRANLIFPLRSGRQAINGFVVVAQPNENRGSYTYQEIRFLENISTQMAISVENAQVVESLERRVRELGVLSQVGRAVNFAVEFDDLLELISNQTQRVLEAPHFYIALQDDAANQMYYAFFMEHNERLRERENMRWEMGKDLLSAIVEGSKPTRLDHYTGTVTSQILESRGVGEDVRAWMGVPLVAGPNRLGIVAVGNSDAGYTYNDDQLRIFSNLSELAAASLDKARLFEETNQRARQLRALNDISRSLQSERNVDRLIPLITSSAVDILNAEAGSLLLAAEDNTGDMIFRIVVGGSGDDLIGKRVEAGRGIVGQVVETAKPVIVNNTRNDNRWQGEATEDDSFQTNSVLAVPLMSSDEVLGVLEVLNKKDGSAYRQEDADVLVTFAGQAAIAIDNARLFEKTDEQFSLRVRELETLERIDAELNRALELKRVAEITIKWAIANTGATAGLLGMVSEGKPPQTMRVLHTYGYEDADFPEGADGESWPLNKGIVSRVIRTKQPDLQPDVSIDPDHVPSLRGGQSQITIPVMAGDDLIAILILEKNVKPTFNLLDLIFVQRLTEHAVIAIENARLVSELDFTTKAQSRYMGVGAHELKNALTPIKSYTEFLLTGMLGEVNEQQQNSLNIIKNNVGRAQLIISDLRDFAQMRAKELQISPERTQIRNVIVETLRPFAQQIDSKQQTLVNNILEKELPEIMGDSQRLIQVMTNFISNANKYSPSGATITLDAEVHNNPKKRKGKAVGDMLVVSIADTGMGISAEDQKKMFTPYFRTDSAKESDIPGTGLGMSLTREIIVQHGGDVWLESVVDKGTTFYFTIPLAPQVEEKPTSPEPTSEPASD